MSSCYATHLSPNDWSPSSLSGKCDACPRHATPSHYEIHHHDLHLITESDRVERELNYRPANKTWQSSHLLSLRRKYSVISRNSKQTRRRKYHITIPKYHYLHGGSRGASVTNYTTMSRRNAIIKMTKLTCVFPQMSDRSLVAGHWSVATYNLFH